MKARFLIPIGLFLVLVVFLALGLQHDPREIPSPLVDKPAPQFKVAQLIAEDKTFSPQDMKGQVWMLNVWASWCVACRVEHPLLMEIGKSKAVPLIGLDYKDTRPAALKFLSQHGDPYTLAIVDTDGRVGIDFGVYGVPETFIIDKQGVIRHKQIGPITEEALQKTIMPLIEKLKKS
ncbi:DsbE family thiol:disulfide interchange protein [Caenimonas koreensis]|uniref:DsbE family thiol:disulfide interchange protein n=1 Tax=Caenimonas koreensis DSM 17982 TaxID=1121255 RepID=A0A844B3X8_9BURK|nr:DsbE family thiol:disulfide interchange protein [Caenimonas koreensis]MRD47932.1 DsbE family thiol:disulfide interchange protein [Caenimonas koreensis DSM 17982]